MITTAKDPTTWETVRDWLVGVPLRIAIIIIIALVVQLVLNRIIRRIVRRASERARVARLEQMRQVTRTAELSKVLLTQRTEQRASAIGTLLRSVIGITVWTIALLMILPLLGINIAPLLASAGIIGIALGFGAQTLVKDYLSGILLIIEDQYGVGDVVDLGDAVGTVEEVALRYTRLRDLTGVVWYVRNGEIVQIANRSQGWQNGSVDVPVSSDEDPERAIAVITKAVKGMETEEKWSRSMLEPATVAGVDSITAGTMIIKVLVKCAPNEHWGVQREILERTKIALQKAGVRGPVLLPGAFTLDTVRNDAATKPANPSQD